MTSNFHTLTLTTYYISLDSYTCMYISFIRKMSDTIQVSECTEEKMKKRKMNKKRSYTDYAVQS